MNDNPLNPTANTNPYPKGSPAAKLFAEALDETSNAGACEKAALELDAQAKELRTTRDRHATRGKSLLDQAKAEAEKKPA